MLYKVLAFSPALWIDSIQLRPLTRKRVCPLPLWFRGGGDTLACGRGGGRDPIQIGRGDRLCGTLGIYVLCGVDWHTKNKFNVVNQVIKKQWSTELVHTKGESFLRKDLKYLHSAIWKRNEYASLKFLNFELAYWAATRSFPLNAKVMPSLSVTMESTFASLQNSNINSFLSIFP